MKRAPRGVPFALGVLVLVTTACRERFERPELVAGRFPGAAVLAVEWRDAALAALFDVPADERARAWLPQDEGLRRVRLRAAGSGLEAEGFAPGAGEPLAAQTWFRRSVQQLRADSGADSAPGTAAGLEAHADLNRLLAAEFATVFDRGPMGTVFERSLGLGSLLSAGALLRAQFDGDALLRMRLDLQVQLARAPVGLVKTLVAPAGPARLEASARALPDDVDFAWLRLDLARVLAQEERALAQEAGPYSGAVRQLMALGRTRLPLLGDAVLEQLGDEYLWLWPRGTLPLDVLRAQLVVAVADAEGFLQSCAGLEFDGWTPFAGQGEGRHLARLVRNGTSFGIALEATEDGRGILRLGSVRTVRAPLPQRSAGAREGLPEEFESLLLCGDAQLPELATGLPGLPEAVRTLLRARARLTAQLQRSDGELRLEAHVRRPGRGK